MTCYKCLNPLDGERIHGLHRKCFFEWFQVEESEIQFSLTSKTAGNSNDPFAHLNSSFFHGKFKKYSGSLGRHGYIIKVRQDPYFELPAMEFLCNQIARLLKILIPDFYLVKMNGEVDSFISKNFMEKYQASNLIHLYREMKDRSYTLENVISVILENTQNELEVERFIQICLFDALTGNHDRHGRNLAFIHTSKGKILSPFYDNPSYLAIEEDGLLKAWHEPSCKIYTSKSSEPKMLEYVIEFCRLGFKNVVQEFYNLVNIQDIEQLVQTSFISSKRKDAFYKLIFRRFHELKTGLYEKN